MKLFRLDCVHFAPKGHKEYTRWVLAESEEALVASRYGWLEDDPGDLGWEDADRWTPDAAARAEALGIRAEVNDRRETVKLHGPVSALVQYHRGDWRIWPEGNDSYYGIERSEYTIVEASDADIEVLQRLGVLE